MQASRTNGVLIGYDPFLDRPGPFGLSIVDSFVSALQLRWPLECPNLTLFYDKQLPSGTHRLIAQEEAIGNAVAYIGLVTNGDSNHGLMSSLTEFWAKPEFAYDPPFDRIFLFGIERVDDFSFNGHTLFLAGTLSLENKVAFEASAAGLARKLGKRLRSYPKRATVVLGLDVPGDATGFRRKLRDELRNNPRYNCEVIEIKPDASSPRFTNIKLRRAMEGADAIVHFISGALQLGWLGSNEYFLDVQIDVAKAIKLPEIFCSGPNYPSPHKTPSNRHQMEIAATIKYDSIAQVCEQLYVKFCSNDEDIPMVTIGLIGDRGDQHILDAIQTHLEMTYKWKVDRPLPGIGDQLYVTLQTYPYLLFYWGAGKSHWYNAKIEDLIEARRDIDNLKVDVAGIYFARTQEDYKLASAESGNLAIPNILTIDCFMPIIAWDDFDPTKLKTFEDAIQLCVSKRSTP